MNSIADLTISSRDSYSLGLGRASWYVLVRAHCLWSSRSGTLSCVMADEGENPHRATVRSDFDNLANDAFTSVRASSPRPRASDVAAHANASATATDLPIHHKNPMGAHFCLFRELVRVLKYALRDITMDDHDRTNHKQDTSLTRGNTEQLRLHSADSTARRTAALT